MLSRLKGFDFYRKIEHDLTKGTTTGAILSLVGAFVMLSLFLLELNDYLSVKVTTDVRMDDFEDSQLSINFNVTVERVACPYLSVDTENVLGTHKMNLTKNIRKWKVKTKGQFQRRLTEASREAHHIEVQEIIPNQRQINTKPRTLNTDNYENFIAQHELVMVDFYAPWCIWSNRLIPVWEHTAQLVVDRYKGKVGIAQVDCTAPGQTELCHRNHISAFPTIITFKNGNTHSNDHYHGDRTTDAFIHHIEWELPKINQEPRHEGEREVKQVERADFLDGDGKHEPAVEGCQIAGSINVRKVPGSLMISAISPKHSFDPALINMTHVIHHLSFGERFLDYELRLLPKEVAQSMRRLENFEYVSTEKNQTHEHYIKVVGTTFNYFDLGTLKTYKYTSHSGTYHGNTKMPVIKFHFDLSPMNVVVTQTYTPFYQFATSLFAIIGGVFTVFGLFDSFVYNTHSLLVRRKMQLGKLT